MYQFKFSILWGEWGLRLLDGMVVTLHLTAWCLTFAIVLGLVFGTLRWLKLRFLEPICWLYVEIARNVPPLVQILFWYFSASYILPPDLFKQMRDVGYEFSAAIVALSIYHGSFVAEIVRAGLNSIHKGQYEGARVLGLSFPQMMRWVILPQALRIVIPPLTNEAVGLTKNTSLAMAIGVSEIAYATKYIDTYTFRGVEALLAATALYMVICLVLDGLGRLINKPLSKHLRAGGPLQPGGRPLAVE